MAALLHMLEVGKRYPGAIALDNVALEIHEGEIVALVGENGAGKSTLINILGGVLKPDSGILLINGAKAHIHSPADAHRLGIAVIHQDLRLVPELSVAENILLGSEPVTGFFRVIDRRRMESIARAALLHVGSEIPTDIPVCSLAHAGQQLVAIARALVRTPRILALDEPTASLSQHETQELHDILRQLRGGGVGIVYISHRLEEVFAIADRVVVLRDGRVVHNGPASGLDRKRLIGLMVGRELSGEYPPAAGAAGEEVLRIERVSGAGVREISLTLHRGEVLGLAGLVGAGRSELARVIFGAEPLTGGHMTLEGKPFHPESPRAAIAAGIGLLTEDRNRLGLVIDMNIRENITLPTLKRFLRRWWIAPRSERAAAEDISRRLRIKTPSVEEGVATLSGGNRQKVVLGRWLLTDAKVLIFDEPTTGIDVGARREIYEIIHELTRRGLGILVISSDLPELLGICNRITVMREGTLAGMLGRNEATQESIMNLATSAGGTRP